MVLLAPSYLWLRYSNHRCSIPHLESRLSSSRQLLTSLWSQFGGKEMGKNGEASWLTLILYIRLYPHDFVCKSLFWLVVWNIWIIFPYIGNVIIHWRTPSFFRGIGIPWYTTNQSYSFDRPGISISPSWPESVGTIPKWNSGFALPGGSSHFPICGCNPTPVTYVHTYVHTYI